MIDSNSDSSHDGRLRIDTHLDADYFDRALRADVIDGLTGGLKELPPKWFYDDVGSQLFEEITRLEEYYPTKAERSILRTHANDIARLADADTLVELGSGAADKTRVLLDALSSHGPLRRFIPFDVSEGILRSSSALLLDEYPNIDIHGVVGDFERHLDTIPGGGQRMIALLGGTIGNFNPHGRKALLTDIVSGMVPGDTFLLGTDLVKDHGRLVRAYDDSKGVTAAFNKNVLQVLNRRLDATFDLEMFEHVATFDFEREWMDLRLRSLADQDVEIRALDLTVHFNAGEEMRTEISAKFRTENIAYELETVGLSVIDWWTDADDDYAVTLAGLS